MTLEFQNQISIQPTESGGGDTPTGRDVGAMYQQASSDGSTWSTYSEMTSNTVAELAILRPFNPSNGLLNYWDSTGILTSTLKFTYETSVNSAWYGNPFYISYSDESSNWYSVSAEVRDNRLLLTTESYSGNTYKQLTASHTYTVKLNLDASTNRALLYCKEEGVDNDFILIDTHTATFPSSLNTATMMISNTLSDSNYISHKFADFDLTDITIDKDGEVIFSRAKSSGGGGSTPSGDAIGIPRELNNGVLQMPSTPTTYTLPNGVTDVGDYAMYYAFYKCGNISTVDLSGLTTVSGKYALYNAFREAGVQSVNIPDLTTITGNYGMGQAFQANTNLQTVEFPKLVSIGESAFSNTFTGCTSLTTVSFPELTTISDEYGFNNSFTNCTGLITVTFPKLTSLSNNAMLACFSGCTNITDVYFPALTTSSFPSGVGYGNTPLQIFDESSSNPMRGKIHLPSNLSSITWIQNSTTRSSSRQQYFGSSYCTVLLDLPATS